MQFSSFILKNEQKEYEKEGIKWDFIDFSENQDVLDLIENRGNGIIGVLDDMCRAPGTTDRVFADTLYKKCSDSKCFSADKKQSALMKFTIQHYAGPVEYSAENFVEKNRDELPKESTEFLRKSPNDFVQELARIIEGSVNVADGNSGDKGRKMAKTVGGQFKQQLKDLRLKIENTAPSYIRCLKPNDVLIPNRFEIPIVAEQLRCGGVLEAVRVARAGFPQHYTHDHFIRRYRPLVWREWQKKIVGSASNKKDVCRNLIDNLFLKLQQLEKAEKKESAGNDGHSGSFVKLGMQMGKTKVFLRQREFEGLERQRGHELQKAAIKLNATFRGFLVRVKWAEYVPLLRKERSDYLKDRERRLLEEKEEQERMEKSISDLAGAFTGSSDLLLKSDKREMVAAKVGSRNPSTRILGPSGTFKWVEKNGKYVKQYDNMESSQESLKSNQESMKISQDSMNGSSRFGASLSRFGSSRNVSSRR
jgi:myosin V